jgi:hypothetical protein
VGGSYQQVKGEGEVVGGGELLGGEGEGKKEGGLKETKKKKGEETHDEDQGDEEGEEGEGNKKEDDSEEELSEGEKKKKQKKKKTKPAPPTNENDNIGEKRREEVTEIKENPILFLDISLLPTSISTKACKFFLIFSSSQSSSCSAALTEILAAHTVPSSLYISPPHSPSGPVF